MGALDNQIGGKHYKELGVQPLESTYLNFGYQGLKAAVYNKVQKYMLRAKEDEIVQLKKARHCLDILIEKAEMEQEAEQFHVEFIKATCEAKNTTAEG